MRTTLDIDADVLDAARNLAEARHTSIGKALSYLARRGATAQLPTTMKNGFVVFQVPEDSQRFGPDEVRAALNEEDIHLASSFTEPHR
jgi:hypothetical protein